MGKFVINKARSGFFFELLARNHEPIASSESYPSLAACQKAILSVARAAGAAKVEDRTREDFSSQKSPKFTVFRDRSGFFRFQLEDRSGKLLIFSEPYKAKASCLNGVKSVIKNSVGAEIFVQE